MKATFDHTVSVLVNAYVDDKLKHQDCSCCAVGNIISHACGYKREVLNDKPFWTKGNKVFKPIKWLNAFGTNVVDHQPGFLNWIVGNKHRVIKSWMKPEKIDSTVEAWAEATGYTIMELARIESAFERAEFGKSKDEWMFNGLMAVVDVLAEIHGVDLTVKESAKLLFTK